MQTSWPFAAEVSVDLGRDGVRLSDRRTGFAIEMEVNAYNGVVTNSPGFEHVWARLREAGLMAGTESVAEVRKRQRAVLGSRTGTQVERVRERLDRIRTTVPFFRDRASEYDPASILSVGDLVRLPFMRKRDLRLHLPRDLLPEDLSVTAELESGRMVMVSTSGTSEERLQVLSRKSIDRLPFGSEDLLGISIGAEHPKTAIFTTPVCSVVECRLGRASYEERLSKDCPDLILNSTDDPFGIDEGFAKAVFGEIRRFEPQIVAADPIYLQCLLRAAHRHNLEPPRVDLIQVGFEFCPAVAKRDIQAAMGATVLSDYGASEENRIALECRCGSLHVRADRVCMEILRAGGPTAPGEVGAIAITTFDTVVPLIRYLIGDCGSWIGRRCQCEFADWPTFELHGRTKDRLRGRNGPLTTLEFDRIVGTPDWLSGYQASQGEDGSLVVDIIPNDGFGLSSAGLQRILAAEFPSDVFVREASRLLLLPSMKVGTTTASHSWPELP